MPLCTAGKHLAAGHLEGCEQGDGAMSDILLGDALEIAHAYGRYRLRAFQCLALALLVNTQDQSMAGWIQIQAYDIADLLDEKRIVG